MNKRAAIGSLVVSGAVLVALAVREDYRDTAYIPVPGDVPTVGFGETEGVKLGDKTTPVRALIRLQASAEKHAQAVRRCAPVPMFQHEFDAWVSFTYNVGPTAFCNSTAARKLNALEYAAACDEMLRWTRAGGRVLPGLVARRKQEHALCMGER